ncbi:MAG: T9SS type A sorting domain-containing protein, partial [Candidatus Marinimicrobia bacterium]|nr:T9SS type A sorting domain-containing protein [Candidatus Neomarinimicrobiota bacterium]
TASAWNLLGNPFVSTIDADQLFSDNSNYTSTVYVYDDANSQYNTWNGSAGDLSNGLIAPYQGFWILSGSSGTTFQFTSSCKSSSIGTFYKTMNDSSGSVAFQLSSGSYNSTVYLSFNIDALEGIDNADAYKLLPMSPSERVVGISYAEGNGLDISNLPYSHDGSISIPLDVMYLTLDDDYNFVTNENDVTMTWDISSLPGHVSLTLTDNATGTAVNLTEESEITFSAEAKGSFPAYGSGGVNIYPQVGESRFTLTVAYSALTSNDELANLPGSFALHPAYPNPFNPSTNLQYDLPEQAQITLTIYNLMGREITQLVNTTQEAGYRSVQWDATDFFGKPVSAGVYLYQIRAGEFVQTRKMVLLK